LDDKYTDLALVEGAKSLAVRLAERASEAEKNRALHPETVQELHEAGILAMGIPKSLGGREANLVTLMQVYETLAGACPSTAWCVGNHTGAVRRLNEVMGEAAEPYLRAVAEEGAVVAHGVVPTGDTRSAPGGFVSSGRWPFMSFSNYARWAVLSTMAPGPPPDRPSDAVGEPPKMHGRHLIVPFAHKGVTLHDNWHTMSLRATSSNDITLDEVFVDEAATPATPSRQSDANVPPALRVPVGTSYAPPCTVLGIAQAAIKDTIEYAKSAGMSYGGASRISMPGNQFAIAEAAMLVESARAYLLQEATAIVDKAFRGEPFERGDGIRMRMAGHMARQNSQKAVEGLWVIRGAHGLYEEEKFERYYRDVRIGTLPAPTAPDRVREQVGKFLFDIPENVEPRWGG
jgi:3-hydroxy-9,10-secoandrosta-1,3,5(10)-triene-9,17-dione monooxygenase